MTDRALSVLWVVCVTCIPAVAVAQTLPTEPTKAVADQQTATPSPEAAAAIHTFSKRLDEIDAAVAKVNDVRAKFEQRRQTPLLKKPMVSKGTMVARGESVRWDTREPRRSTMVVGTPVDANAGTAELVRMYYPNDKLIEVYETGTSEKEFMGAFLPRLSVLRAKFSLSPIAAQDLGGAANNRHLLGVLLEPREDRLKKHIRSVRVLIDDSIPAATRVIVTDAQGDTTEITFSDVRTNTDVTREDVDLRVPGDVRVSYPMRGETTKGSAPAESPAGSAPRPTDP